MNSSSQQQHHHQQQQQKHHAQKNANNTTTRGTTTNTAATNTNKLGSWLRNERDSLKLTEKVYIDLSTNKSFSYRDSVAIVDAINNTCQRIQKIRIKLGTSPHLTTTTDYLLASYLIEAIHVKNNNEELEFEIELALSANSKDANQDDAVTFLRSSVGRITSLIIERSGASGTGSNNMMETSQGSGGGGGGGKPKVTPAMAKAIASLSNLREMTIGREYGDLHDTSIQSILLECVHQNKIRPTCLKIDGKGFAGMGLFLRSECASRLTHVEYTTSRFSHVDAIELKEGLLHNSVVKTLVLNCWNKHNDLNGLPVLYECMKEETTLQRLKINDCGRRYSTFFRPFLSALSQNPKPSLRHLSLEDFFDQNAGPLVREFLTINENLESLSLQVSSTDFLTEDFCLDIAKGISKNKGALRSLKLKQDQNNLFAVDATEAGSPDLVLDLSPLIKSLPCLSPACLKMQTTSPIIRNLVDTAVPAGGGGQLTELCLSFGNCHVSSATCITLANSLQHSTCPLKKLDLTLGYVGLESIKSLITGVKKSSNLEKVDLAFPNCPWNDIDRPEQYYGICSDVLSSSSSSNHGESGSDQDTTANATPSLLSHFTLTLDDVKYDDLSNEMKWSIMERSLKTMETNTTLECAKLAPLTACSKDFKSKLTALTVRNKVRKASAKLEELTLDPVTELPGILTEIESRCQEFGVSAELYFVRIWFSLLVSRPEEVEKYCPSRGDALSTAALCAASS